MIKRLKKWIFSLQGKFILVASMCLLVFTTTGSFLILSREKNLYMQDITNQGKILSEISRLMLTNVMVYKELGMMDEQDLIDYLDYFIMNLMERDKRVKYLMVLDNNGLVLAHSSIAEYGKIYSDSSTLKAIAGLKTEIIDERFQDDSILKITVPLNIDTKNWGVIQIGFSTKSVHESIDSLKKEIVVVNIVFSAIALMIISIGARVLAKPVVGLTRKMDSKKHMEILIRRHLNLKTEETRLANFRRVFYGCCRDSGKQIKNTKRPWRCSARQRKWCLSEGLPQA